MSLFVSDSLGAAKLAGSCVLEGTDFYFDLPERKLHLSLPFHRLAPKISGPERTFQIGFVLGNC